MNAYRKLFRFKWAFAALILSLVLLLQGCTVVGFAIGGLADGPLRETVPPTEYADIKSGNKITVNQMNGDIWEGKFVIVSQKEKEEYRNNFAAFLLPKTTDTASFPLPGQTIFLFSKDLQKMEAEFIGFDFRITGKSFLCLIAHENENSGFDSTSLQSRFKGIKNSNDNFWETELILKLLSDQRLPLLSQMQVDWEGRTREIHLEDIAVIKKHRKQNWRMIGSAIGFAIDVVILKEFIIPGMHSPEIDSPSWW